MLKRGVAVALLRPQGEQEKEIVIEWHKLQGQSSQIEVGMGGEEKKCSKVDRNCDHRT